MGGDLAESGFDISGEKNLNSPVELEPILSSKMLMKLLFLITVIPLVQCLPPKGCTSCLMVPIEESEKAGISSTNKTRHLESGCFVQTVQCASSSTADNSETYIQFNKGRKGLFAAVQQTIQLFCNDEGKWEFRHSQLTLTVTALTCLST